MQNNYYFLRQLVVKLEPQLLGATLAECYTQSKGELSLGFSRQGSSDFFIKGTFQPDITCLYFPPQLQRARRNSTDLFEEVKGREVTGLLQYRYDRSFSISFKGGYSLLFKMHGNRANILLLEQEQPVSLFKNKLAKDWNVQPMELHREPRHSFEYFAAQQGNVKKVFPALGQEPMQLLELAGWSNWTLEEKWKNLTTLEQQLLVPESFYVCRVEEKPELLLFPQGELLLTSTDPIEAINYFYRSFTHDWALRREKQEMISSLERQVRGTESYLYKTMEKLEELQTSASHRHMGDLIMANLHQIPAGAETATLQDFYSDSQLQVKLKRDLSPQKNAELYYRKAKNQQLEIQHLEANIAAKEERLERLQRLQQQVTTEDNLKKLRSLRKEELPENDEQPVHPFRQFEFQQYQILVGKGASQNDELLRYHSRKDDLWLHAKDVSGSHVIIRRLPGKSVPAPVKEKAAQLAAWYSKRKSDSLCPVICTSRKWVRKIKGAPAGAVVVDREEEVLLVEPKAFQ